MTFYADDTTMVTTNDNLEQSEKTANLSINSLCQRFSVAKLKLNEPKTNFLLFHTHQRHQNIACSINVNNVIQPQQKAKLLTKE